MSGGVFLGDFVTIKPPVKISQEDTIAWLLERHLAQASLRDQETMKAKFRHYTVKKDIQTRYFAIPDVEKTGKALELYSEEKCRDIGYKTEFFSNYSLSVFNEFYSDKLSLPDHIIHVTCTGYVSPSAPQMVVAGYQSSTKVTHAYHMGCYAAFPSVRMAQSFVKSCESKVVDVVHTEVCSLHMDSATHTPEQIIIQTLFADGNIKYSLSASPFMNDSYEIITSLEMIVPESSQDMRWEIKNWGFAMTLSRKVPQKIEAALLGFIETLANNAGIPKEQLIKESIFAIHPGGPKIVDRVASRLDLSLEQIRYSNNVLLNRGNMSSATLPHVWEEIINARLQDGQTIVSLAFGPGLSIFGSVFKYRKGA